MVYHLRQTSSLRSEQPPHAAALVWTVLELLAAGGACLLASLLEDPWELLGLFTEAPTPLVVAALAAAFYGLDLAVLFQERKTGPSGHRLWGFHLVPGVSAILRALTLSVLVTVTMLEILLTGVWNTVLFLALPLLKTADGLAVASGRLTDEMDRTLARLELAVESALGRLGPTGRPFPFLAGWKTTQSEL